MRNAAYKEKGLPTSFQKKEGNTLCKTLRNTPEEFFPKKRERTASVFIKKRPLHLHYFRRSAGSPSDETLYSRREKRGVKEKSARQCQME